METTDYFNLGNGVYEHKKGWTKTSTPKITEINFYLCLECVSGEVIVCGGVKWSSWFSRWHTKGNSLLNLLT